MRWRLVGLAIVGCLLAVVTGVSPAAAAPQKAAPWGTAQPVTLPPVINFGQFATINSIACPSAGNCTAVGHFTDSHDHIAAIAASETKHVWAAAVQPLGTVLSGLSLPDLLGVSCLSPGNCYAVGVVTMNQAWTAGLLLSEVKGAWNSASYLSSDDKGTQLSAVSCPVKATGGCAAGGYYVDASGKTQALLLSQSANGEIWAEPAVPGLAALNAGGDAVLDSVSCPSAANCAAAGYYTASGGSRQAFVVTEKSGSWSAAREVPGTGSLNAGGVAVVNSVSCAPGSGALNCVLGGRYQAKNGSAQAFVDLIKNGAWKQASSIGGGHNLGGYAQVSTVSCASAGNCAVGGYYLTAAGSSQRYEAFVASLKGFSWQSVEELPGLGTLNQGKTAQLNTLSCPSAAFCAAGGFYSDGHLGDTLAFVANGAIS